MEVFLPGGLGKWGLPGFSRAFKAASEAADTGSMPKTRPARGFRRWRRLVRVSACLLAAALPVAGGPAWGTEPREIEAAVDPSCQAPGVARPLDSLQAAVVRAVHIEAGSGKTPSIGEVTVLNGRGYNYGPSLVKPTPPQAPSER